MLFSLFSHQAVSWRVWRSVWTNLDLISPSEAFELPKPHVLRLHPPLPEGRTLLRALPCQHHDQPAVKQEECYYTPNAFTFHIFTLCQDSSFLAGLLGWNIKKSRSWTHEDLLSINSSFTSLSCIHSSHIWDFCIDDYLPSAVMTQSPCTGAIC